MNINPILNVDSYKTSHYLQYPPGAEVVSSYVESRGGDYDQTVFFGLQVFLKECLSKPITREHIEEAAEVLSAHGVPFNRDGWEYILEEHGGYLPLEVEAIPEGTRLPTEASQELSKRFTPSCLRPNLSHFKAKDPFFSCCSK